MPILENLSKFLNDYQIVTPDHAEFSDYLGSTTPTSNTPMVIVKPYSEDQVTQIVALANAEKKSVFPIASGNNWGYGDRTGTADGQIILDLSAMNQIRLCDEELGIVTIEPGVTQQDLYEFLENNSINLSTPITGAGPSCGLISNALERGFGFNPIQDHFTAVQDIRGVLADGSIYHSPFSSITNNHQPIFKWHTGPYLDGLFSQGNTLIVTQMTLALQPLPEKVNVVLAEFQSHEEFLGALSCINKIKSLYGGNTSPVQCSNELRVLSMLTPFPKHLDRTKPIPKEEMASFLKEGKIKPWSMYFTVHGTKNVTKGITSHCVKLLKEHGKVTHLSEGKLGFILSTLKKLPFTSNTLIQKVLGLQTIFDFMHGKPSEMALPLAYWKTAQKTPSKNLNPGRDECGIVWFAPVIPLRANEVDQAINMIEEICQKHGFDAMITANIMTRHCIECTLPILYDKETQSEQVQACYKELFKASQELGYVPYRYPNFFMEELTEQGHDTYWKHAKKIKDILDPHGTISPGRYCPH